MASPQDAPAAEVPIQGAMALVLWDRKVGENGVGAGVDLVGFFEVAWE
jgi:hypothetical protein